MNIEEIPSDELVVMTLEWYKQFELSLCRPMCHSCLEYIPVGTVFHLATVKAGDSHFIAGKGTRINIQSRDVMLCEKCTPETLDENNRIRKEEKRLREIERAKSGGCFRINGKIIH